MRMTVVISGLIIFLSLLAQLSIPLGAIPITGQTLAVGLIASIFPWRVGIIVVLGYLSLGAMGLPIFANQKSGIDAITGATGGFLVGFLFYVVTVRVCLQFSKNIAGFIVASILATAVTLAFGGVWLYVSKDLTFMKVIKIAVIPFILPGLIKSVSSAVLGFLAVKHCRSILEKVF